jgi:hypothetical protein
MWHLPASCDIKWLSAMKIDIDRLSEEELVELNHKIVSRLRFLREMRSHVQMLDSALASGSAFSPQDAAKCLAFSPGITRKA